MRGVTGNCAIEMVIMLSQLFPAQAQLQQHTSWGKQPSPVQSRPGLVNKEIIQVEEVEEVEWLRRTQTLQLCDWVIRVMRRWVITFSHRNKHLRRRPATKTKCFDFTSALPAAEAPSLLLSRIMTLLKMQTSTTARSLGFTGMSLWKCQSGRRDCVTITTTTEQ